ncbi:MAG: efflux RND transporter periplasmic adaptor subunit [Anaerolineales bacterium]
MKTKWIFVFVLTLALTACGQSETPTPISTLSLEDGASGSDSPASVLGDTVIASAEVRPVDTVDLSFPLLGTVISVEVEVGDSVTAGQTLATLDTTIIEARIAEAEARVLSAETQVSYLKRVGVGNAYEQIEAAQADVDRAQAVVDQLKAQLAQATLTTPIAGTIIKVDVAPGETANPGQAIIIVANLDQMRIETTDLSERDIPAVHIGQAASVFIDALDESFEGEVIDIDRQSETVGGDVTYKVTVELNQQPAGLRWGMSAEVEIQTE